MQTKKLYFILGVVILLVGVAAFVAGRFINGGVGNVTVGGPRAGHVSISLNDINPAPALPNIKADSTGSFIERRDNTTVVQAVSFGADIGGVSGDSPVDENSGVTVKVIVTSKTKIYKGVTRFPAPVNGEIHNVQQVAERGTLERLNSQTFMSEWGRRSGHRIVAEVFFYSNPQSIKKSVM